MMDKEKTDGGDLRLGVAPTSAQDSSAHNAHTLDLHNITGWQCWLS